MAMIRKEVTGSGESMKLVRNAKQAPTTAQGSTQRTSFEGSRDTRSAGSIGPNRVLRSAPGYVDQGDVMMGDTSHSRSFTTPGARGATSSAVRVASENVTRGMGGRVIKDMN
jgi:hypothetical protein